MPPDKMRTAFLINENLFVFVMGFFSSIFHNVFKFHLIYLVDPFSAIGGIPSLKMYRISRVSIKFDLNILRHA